MSTRRRCGRAAFQSLWLPRRRPRRAGQRVQCRPCSHRRRQADEAEQAGHELLRRFPDAHDGYARLGLVHEVRGAHREAIDYYRKVIAFARKRPGIYNSEFIEGYKHLISHLEPTIAD